MFVVLVAFIDIDPHDAYSWVYTEILQSSPYIVFFVFFWFFWFSFIKCFWSQWFSLLMTTFIRFYGYFAPSLI